MDSRSLSGYRLVRLNGPCGPDEWPLPTKRRTVLGRRDASATEPDVDLSPDRTVSRRHAEIWFDGDGWWIEDLKSKHGTILGARRIPAGSPVRCVPGAEIRVGGTDLAIFAPECHRLRHDALVIDLSLGARFSYALAISGAQLISRLAVRNWGRTATGPGRLELSLGGIARAGFDVRRLAPGESRVLLDPVFEIDRRALSAAADQRWHRLVVRLNGQRVESGNLGCSFLAYNEWSYASEDRPSLAAFVQPDHPVVIQAAREATTGLPLHAGGAAVVRRLYDYLATAWRIDYRKDRPPAKANSQTLRLAGDVLWDPTGRAGEGTCIDLALLLAGCLEALRLQPLVALVDLGRSWHAVAGCWRATRRRLEVLPADRDTLLGEATWVDPNGCVRDPAHRAEFTAATARGQRDLANGPLVFALDIAAARASGIHPLPLSGAPRHLDQWPLRRLRFRRRPRHI